ncbi:MAG: tyrosine recombinase XerC [Acidimicrobiales bacterium]
MPRRAVGKRIALPEGGVRVRGKNPNGTGSVYVLPDGSWRATWTDLGGNRRVVRGRTHALAVERREQAILQDRATSPSQFGQVTTVAEMAEWWLEHVATQTVRASSLGKYRDRVNRLSATLGDKPVATLRSEDVAQWVTSLTRAGLAPNTIKATKVVLGQVLDQAVRGELVARNVATGVRGPASKDTEGRALSVEDARRLLAAARDDRLGAAVWLLFVNGWRVSEVLGLAWDDLDLDAGTVTVRRAATYVDGIGMVLGPTKTKGALGNHHLAPGVVAILQARQAIQDSEREAAGPVWRSNHRCEGQPVPLVFTTLDGGIVNRQAVTKVVARCATSVGIDPAGLGTHGGRRTVITALYGAEGLDLADIARHVGHASPSTTAGYVRDLGNRPANTAAAAARLLGQ